MEYQDTICEYGAGQTPLWHASNRDDDLVGDWLHQAGTDNAGTKSIPFSELVELAEQGDEFAMVDVAFVYAVGGDGVQKDPVKSFYWMRRAAKLGAGEAQYCLGRFNRLGFWEEQSVESARHWFTLAAQNGVRKALQQLIELES